jgi:cellulose synthase/poly-beta-1,6-N-acetylglucosamine synthase-like glycosyltransferase
MLQQAVAHSGLGLILAALVLWSTGHRLRRGHWVLSLALIGALALAAWWLQGLGSGGAPPPGPVLGVTLVAGVAVTAAFDRWNAAGHAAFTAILLAAVSFLAYACYVVFAARLGPWSLAFALPLLALQFGSLILLLAHTFEIIDVVCSTRPRRAAVRAAAPDYTPMVSLHVPTHNEPPELVIETLDALARLDYPHFEVLVIDNNTADERLWRPVEAHCARLGSRFRFFHLMPWPGFKSGALNYALSRAAPDAAIVGVVDADYVVEPGYLRDLVGYFADPRLGFVQTPQDYRDATARGRYGRALYHAYLYFFKISMAARDQYNAIIFAGTMGLIRRSALEEVGGWNEWCITEDAELSVRLLDAGYQSVYVDHTYGRGLMPIDYAGLKKQRFRWAFGGMQLLRLHAGRLLLPRAGGRLTLAQRWMYISGGLQWLNDPLALAFSLILLIGAGALLLGGSFYLQPLAGAAILAPPLFILFGALRFLWAFRVRARCTWGEAADALTILLGLTWVVSLACMQGLVRRQGVFLRTPKQGERPTLADTVRIVWWELSLGGLCVAAVLALAVLHPPNRVSGQTVALLLLVWQAAIYLSAARTSVWNYLEGRAPALLPAGRRSYRSLGHVWGRFTGERRAAAWAAAGIAAVTVLFYLGLSRAPTAERIMRADPLGQFIGNRSLVVPSLDELAGAALILEADAARRSDVERALRLWDPDGVIVDANFTPGDPTDDLVWRGTRELRERYQREFRDRRYLRLAHRNLRIVLSGDTAVIMNDVDAVFESGGELRTVSLPESDRWVLHRTNGEWRFVRLELNRARVPGIPARSSPPADPGRRPA